MTTTRKSSISSLLALADDTLLRIFDFILNSTVLDASAFARLKHALPLAISCSRLHALFFTSVRVIDLATLQYAQTAHYHGKACDTCSSLVTVSTLFVFIRRASSNLRSIRLPPLPVDSTASLITYISQYCPRLEQIHFTDNSAVILPLAHCLLRLPKLTRLSVLNPSEIILSALVREPNSLTHLSLFSVAPRDVPSLINLLQRNARNLRSFTLSFGPDDTVDTTPLADPAAALPLSITGFLDYLSKNLTTDMPHLEHLDICTATVDDIPDKFESIAHQPVDIPELQQTTITASETTVRHLVLRTVRDHYVETLLPFKRLLRSSVHFVLALDDVVVDLPAENMDERGRLLKYCQVPSKVLSARVEANLNHTMQMRTDVDYSCLNTLAIMSGRRLRPGLPMAWHRARLLAMLTYARNTLTTVRFLDFPSTHPHRHKRNFVPWIVDILREAPNVRTVDVSADYVISACRGNAMAKIAHAMEKVRVLRVITGSPQNECRDGAAPACLTDSRNVVIDLIGAVPELLKCVMSACANMERIECHCFLPAGSVQMTEGSGFLLTNALACVDKANRTCAGLDTWSFRSQLCVWRAEFEKMRRATLCM